MAGLSMRHAEWLESRKLDVDLAAKLGVASRGPWIAFPYTAGEKTLWSKLRTPDKRFRTDPAGIDANRLWNEDCLTEDPGREPMIITEGEPDALSVLQAGYQFVVSAPTGALDKLPDDGELPAPPYLLEHGKLKPHIEKFNKVVLLADGDQAGVNLRKVLANTIGARYCWVPTYPEGCKDANDVLMAHGVDGVRALVENAQPIKSDGFTPLTDIADQATPRTYTTGLEFLDPHMKLARPHFLVIAGTAGAGKSTVTQALTFGLCWHHRMRASIFNGEGHLSIVLKRAKRFWRGVTNANTADERMQRERDHWIREHLALIKPPQDEMPTFEWLLWAMEQHALNRRRDILVVDPWNEVLHDRGRHQSLTEYTGEAIVKMKRLATRHNLILIVSHHVRKPEEARRTPTMYDVADSAHWNNKADHGLIVHRPDTSANRTLLHVAKSKDHEILGRPGKVWVTMNMDRFALNQILDAPGADTAGEASVGGAA